VAFKSLEEKDVEDGLLLPRVNPKKDFKAYLRSINDSGAV